MARAKKETKKLENEDLPETLSLEDESSSNEEAVSENETAKELINEKGEEMPSKVTPKSLSNDPLIAMPKSLESFINKDLLSINAKVELETNESLALGTLLISEDFGESFKKCPDEDISAKENIKLAMLKDHALSSGVYGVLLAGEINLKGVHASALKKAFMQNLIINNKE
ncbi:hypothetical protein CSUB8523_0999 [Campylobacter subantarcticus LMG 24377]|uniref:Uncharacterized protein n=1 Tax=Campylobacter subantarcticus TaxID=497724 RepID=A0ABW9N787_9BACT|nr:MULTISPECIES: hypothetical protein [Campylobacter]AJC92512.1 hypothetical protein CSUB8523_0999 [Campylobacter subantarcticus LMG 24377]EAL3939486.1 hypothetical protein [Campylobacter lari]MBF7060532.1 hypothetical protein [Campylobacter volucris]MPC00009.1 hypothetical protein [Campylobacter subantarcticus]